MHARISLSKKASGWDTSPISSHVRRMNMTIRMDEDSQLALVQTIKDQILCELRDTEQIGSPYYSTHEAAVYLRCTPQRIRELVCHGRLRGFHEGRRLLVLRDEVHALAQPNPWNTEVAA
jgi:excisionase family DNA binding protein